jgi:hypothetical protein
MSQEWKPPEYRHRTGWRKRLVLQVRYRKYTWTWVWGQWRDARVEDLPPMFKVKP